MLAALAALILGFLVRRSMIPSAVHYLAHRPPDPPQSIGDSESPGAGNQGAESGADTNQGGAADSEHLTTGDRRTLDAVIKQKAK